ncbi:hypothetical protein CIPAW_05G262600 [Carya illinoinensis]|uniref:Uncharacterized protein n=1 Tax=Carya illinoinensis TaxID=32201 RepID=A0A8T1QPA3_CARIL|nr:hypothetical protein CIPAW_05G262600 [Carya illinoinensis]
MFLCSENRVENSTRGSSSPNVSVRLSPAFSPLFLFSFQLPPLEVHLTERKKKKHLLLPNVNSLTLSLFHLVHFRSQNHSISLRLLSAGLLSKPNSKFNLQKGNKQTAEYIQKQFYLPLLSAVLYIFFLLRKLPPT